MSSVRFVIFLLLVFLLFCWERERDFSHNSKLTFIRRRHIKNATKLVVSNILHNAERTDVLRAKSVYLTKKKTKNKKKTHLNEMKWNEMRSNMIQQKQNILMVLMASQNLSLLDRNMTFVTLNWKLKWSFCFMKNSFTRTHTAHTNNTQI